MKKNLLNIVLLAMFSFLLIPFGAEAQGQRVQVPESPKVNSDHTVSFYLNAPNATKVELSTQFIKGNQPMLKDASGIWSVTLGPATPDIYPYNFIVDGVSVADPGNQNIFPNERFKSSLVDIPGENTAIYSQQDVPHGTITYCYYKSKTINSTRPLVVYTPPGYNKNDNKYPVFYLISGTTDTEETWYKVGRVNNILDNLIAQKKALPMIVVMPYGNTPAGTPDPTSIKAADMYKVFNNDLIGSIIPYVEDNFRVVPEREKRAIGGFSRGGGQTLFAGFTNLDKFAWMCSYSAYLTPEVFDTYFSNLAAAPEVTNKKLKLFWLGVGSEDFLYKDATTFIDLLKGKKIDHKTLITGGGHTWMNARHYLTETLQLLFK
jgi:enterochelin esterase-like enzyme